MMDIVERLLNKAAEFEAEDRDDAGWFYCFMDAELDREAAVEIERLRSALRQIAEAPDDVTGGARFASIASAAINTVLPGQVPTSASKTE